METLIKESSWFFCDKCYFKTKARKDLNIHKVKHHSLAYEENYSTIAGRLNYEDRVKGGYSHVAYVEKIKCRICWHISSEINIMNHIKTEHEDLLDDWLLFTQGPTDFFCNNSSLVYTRKLV